MKVEIDADRFSVIAAVRWGYRVTFSLRQTLPGRDGMLRVKRAEERVSFFHEESHWGELDIRGRSPTTIMVPLWQHGQRLRSTPVIFSSKSLVD